MTLGVKSDILFQYRYIRHKVRSCLSDRIPERRFEFERRYAVSDKDILEKYRKHMVAEGIIKSVMCGLIVGLGVNIIVAFISWLFGFTGGLWLALGLGIGLAAFCATIFYFKIFKPTPEGVARRLDSLGLDERVITSVELENAHSTLSRMQRADASFALDCAHASLGKKMFSFSFPVAIVVAVGVLGAGAVALDTVSGLSAEGLLPSGTDIINGEREKFVAVSFVTGIYDESKDKYVEYDGGGIIDGDPEQLVLPGEYCDTVVAVADDGWAFECWVWLDGGEEYKNTDPSLTISLTENAFPDENIQFIAAFYKVEEDDDAEQGDGGEGEGGDEGDDANDQPQDGDDSNDGDGDDSDDNNDNQGDQNPGGTKPDPNQDGNGASGKYDDNNQIIDGNTHYRDVYQQYYDQAMQILAEGGEIPPELRLIIETYFGIIL